MVTEVDFDRLFEDDDEDMDVDATEPVCCCSIRSHVPPLILLLLQIDEDEVNALLEM